MINFIIGLFTGAIVGALVIALLKSSETEYREQRERQVKNDNA